MPSRPLVDYAARTVTLAGAAYRLDPEPDGRYRIVDAAGAEAGWATITAAGPTWSGELAERVVMTWLGHCLAEGHDPWIDPLEL